MVEAIQRISKETGEDWFRIVQALKDGLIITTTKQRELESYFFALEDKKNGKYD